MYFGCVVSPCRCGEREVVPLFFFVPLLSRCDDGIVFFFSHAMVAASLFGGQESQLLVPADQLKLTTQQLDEEMTRYGAGAV